MNPFPRLRSTILFLAGVIGACGVALAAAASHGTDAKLLGNAAMICLAHGPTLLAIYAGYTALRTAAAAGLVLGFGTLLFAADLFIRHVSGSGVFPMAAPVAGMAMIVGWLLVAAGALFGRKNT